ncbi:hypothetical protein ACSLO7_30515, partial [Klebsiella pneumoniae]
VRQVRQNRDVLLFRRRQVCRREAQNAAEDEEHHGQHHHDVGAREGFNGMVIKSLRSKGKSIEINKLNKLTALFMLITTWIVA